MDRRRLKQGLYVVIIIVLVYWIVHSLWTWLGPDRETQDAEQMLYQISFFQIELLHSYLYEARDATHTEQLHGLKQAAYSADYTHERYVLTIGKQRLTELDSIAQIMQYVLRLQIGGQRALKTEEREVLRHLSDQFEEIYHHYGNLLSRSGKINSSRNQDLKQANEKLSQYLRKILISS